MWGPSVLDPVPGEPKGAAGVETRRSRERSRAAPHLPQVSSCSLRNERVIWMYLCAQLFFLYLLWKFDCRGSVSFIHLMWFINVTGLICLAMLTYFLLLLICCLGTVLIVVFVFVHRISLYCGSTMHFPIVEFLPWVWAFLPPQPEEGTPARGKQKGLGSWLLPAAPALLPVTACLQEGMLNCSCRSAPPTLETMRPKQEWEMRLNRIRMTKESVRVSSCQTAPSLRVCGSHQCYFMCLVATLFGRRVRPKKEVFLPRHSTVSQHSWTAAELCLCPGSWMWISRVDMKAVCWVNNRGSYYLSFQVLFYSLQSCKTKPCLL